MGFLLGEMTWEEFEEASSKADFVILPIGSVEQHSLHLPLLVDSIRAEMLARELAEKSSELRLLVLPTLYYGYSEHHINFPGTITLHADTLEKVIRDIGWSLSKHGVRRFVILNCHGGNIEPIKLATNRLQRDLDLKVFFIHWTSFARDLITEWAKSEQWGHACEHETSLILLFRPDLVKKEKIKKPEVKARRMTRPLRYWEDLSESGGIGDPTKASAEFARELVDKVTQRILDALKKEMDT